MELAESIFETQYPKKHVLVVEDDESIRPIIRRMFKRLNPNAVMDWASSAEEARSLISSHAPTSPFDLILSDVYLEGKETGLDFVADCRRQGLQADIVVTSGKIVSLPGIAYPYLAKPFSAESFNQTMRPYVLGEPILAIRSAEWNQWVFSFLVLTLLALLWLITPASRLGQPDTGWDSMLHRFALNAVSHEVKGSN